MSDDTTPTPKGGKTVSAAPAPEAESKAAAAQADLDALWAKHVHNSPLSRDTAAYNKAYEAMSAVRALFSRLDEE
ncbi:hypothetical protein [Paramagnetospirillum magneticum]|uniref:Uncharacterized protein n=1 Tax=Paramagnetospirillum magneticum (strain ATCC 700264 / AMB-1) TaxID=342108 RepID=Q2W6E8_PARM1|nr:hypothetical protein [Paramagnetospirillum magneticum]BAE50577.1 hypothetical protein amb1773 [Paramagnetospirillum magneticum AMB-1]